MKFIPSEQKLKCLEHGPGHRKKPALKCEFFLRNIAVGHWILDDSWPRLVRAARAPRKFLSVILVFKVANEVFGLHQNVSAKTLLSSDQTLIKGSTAIQDDYL